MIHDSYIMEKITGKRSAILEVIGNKVYLSIFILLFLASFIAYAYVLSSSALNLSPEKIIFNLDIEAISISLIISLLISISITLNIFSFANGINSNTKFSLGSIIGGIVPFFICCSSLIPSLLALFGASASAIIFTTGKIQGPFATYESLFISASIVLLIFSIYLASRSISGYCKSNKVDCRIVDENEK